MSIARIFQEFTCWNDFRALASRLSEKRKGDSFEVLSKYFLQLHPTYASQLRSVWHLNEVPSNVKKHLNLPDPDEGIDLVAHAKDGEYWAIQCKYRQDESKSLTRKELTTFTDLAFNICRHISFGLVCTNTDRFSHKLALYGDRVGFCAGDTWRSLDHEFFGRVHRAIAARSTLLEARSPFPHQTAAIENAYQYFVERGNSRGKMIMPCGTGKSLAAYWIAERLKARMVLVAVPNLALIRQTFEVWARETVANGRDVSWIAVCSDKSVGDIERDEIVVRTQDLGIRVHTDSDEIAGWLKNHKENLTVVYTTYQSGRSVAEAARKAGITFDLAILDEAHKTVGRKGSLFSHLLYEDNIVTNKRIFMTATERRYIGASDDIASMNDPQLYGETFELLSFKRALEAHPPILSDYKIMTVLVSSEEIKELIDRNLLVRPDKGNWDREVEAEMLAALIALRKAMQRHPIRRAISFHSSIARARAFRDSQDLFTANFRKYGELECFHVYGSMPTARRSRIVDEFARSNRGLITNARCLTEGVDIPSVDCVLFADPKRSTVDIVQAVGRALRRAEGKRLGYVIVPVLLNSEVTDSANVDSRAFDTVLMVLRALAANDERIIEYFRAVSQGRRSAGTTIAIELEIPLGLRIDADSFINAIEYRLWSRLAKLSWRPFEEARAFVRSLGLKSSTEWNKYCAGNLSEISALPPDIPRSPDYQYQDQGWISWGDWLGTGTVAYGLREYRPFHEARDFVCVLGLSSVSEWWSYCRGEIIEKGTLPKDIPAVPHSYYRNRGWINYGDWLGTGVVAPRLRKYRSFQEGRAFVHDLRLKSGKDWKRYCAGKLSEKGTIPTDIPANPWRTYKDRGWAGWDDWLGRTDRPKRRKFEQARTFARSLGLKSYSEWQKYCKGELPDETPLPEDISKYPDGAYKSQGWISWGDWLGTNVVSTRFLRYREFEEAREYVRSLGLKNTAEWREYCKGLMPKKGQLPPDIPKSPHNKYKSRGWRDYGDWLGTGRIASNRTRFRTFEQAREFARSLNLKSQAEWWKYYRGRLPEKGTPPEDIPTAPEQIYKGKGWVSWGDWLGSGTVSRKLRTYRSFEEARNFVWSLSLKNHEEWRRYCSGRFPEKGIKPPDIPANPNVRYRRLGYTNLSDWLGNEKIPIRNREFLPFEEARSFAHHLGLKDQQEWKQFCKGGLPEKGQLPKNVPSNPNRTYKDQGWVGFGDWLGTGRIAASQRVYRSFEEAKAFARSLGLKSGKEWRRFSSGQFMTKGILPSDIPAEPVRVYKGKGWISWGDWLGTGTVASQLKKRRSFEEARQYARTLSLASVSEWREFCRGENPEKGLWPGDISRNPNETYKDKGWEGWGDWLGTGTVAPRLRAYLPFQEARLFVHGVGLLNYMEWQKFCKGLLREKGTLPRGIPVAADRVYKNRGWINWKDWLGTQSVPRPRRKIRSFHEAREFVQSLGLKSASEWRNFCKGVLPEKGIRPKDIPSNPNAAYKDTGWRNWGDWLGTESVAKGPRRY